MFELQKLKTRKAALQRTKSVTEKQKMAFKGVLIPEMMSSEESEDDGTFSVSLLPWRSDNASDFFYGLDSKHTKRSSKKSQKMCFERCELGRKSSRVKPASKGVPEWCFV